MGPLLCCTGNDGQAQGQLLAVAAFSGQVHLCVQGALATLPQVLLKIRCVAAPFDGNDRSSADCSEEMLAS